MPALPIHIPKQIQPGAIHSPNAPTTVNTQQNSPVATRTASPVQPPFNAGDLVSALDAINLVQDTVEDEEVTGEVDTSDLSPMPGVSSVPAAAEDGDMTVDMAVTKEPSPPPAAKPISSAALPHTPARAANSALSLLVFGGDSPLTPLPVTPHTSTLAVTLKRKRSDANIGRSVRKKDDARPKLDDAHPKKRARKLTEKAGSTSNGKATKATRASSRKREQASNNIAVVDPTTPAVAAPKFRPTISARARRARAAAEDADGTPSKAGQAPKKIGDKLTKTRNNGRT